MDMEDIMNMKLIERFANDTIWLKEHKSELIGNEEYKNKFVAVMNQEIISSNADLDKLIEELKKKNIDTSIVVIEFIPKEDIIIIY